MSILAGFDLVLELDRHALLAVVRSLPLPMGFNLNPPFEQTVTIPGAAPGTTDGQAHFVMSDIDLFLQGASGTTGNAARIRIFFEHSSILGNSFVRGLLAGADLINRHGSFDITVPIAFGPGATDPTSRVLTLDLTRATVHGVIAPDAVASSSPLNVISGVLAGQLQAQVNALGMQTAPVPLTVNPTAVASLSPLVVANASMAIFAPTGTSDADPQSLAIFASFAGGGAGNVALRSASGVPSGRNFVLALSPGAFHRMVFVPAVQVGLGAMSPAQLPPTCGPAASIPMPSLPQWLITHAEDTFRTGAVGVFIHANDPSGDPSDGWTSTTEIDVHGSIRLSIVPSGAGQAIQPAWHTDSVNGGQSYGWAWWLTGILGPFITMAVANIVIDAASGGAASALALSPGGPIPIPLALPGITVTDVQIETDQLLLDGTARAAVTPWDGLAVQVSASSEGVGLATSGGGVYHSVGCPEGDFSYTTTIQAQRVTFTARPRFAALPVTYQWSIAGFNAPIAVSGSGTATLSATCDLPDPPPVQSSLRGDVTVSYEVSPAGDSLAVAVDPAYGNFQLNAFCQATDSAGQRSEPSAFLLVQTHQITFGDGWDMALADCARAFQRWWRDHQPHFVPQLPLPDDAPRVNPAERFGLVGLAAESVVLAEAVLGATAQGKEGISVLRNLRTSHAASLIAASSWYNGSRLLAPAALPQVAFQSRTTVAAPAWKQPAGGYAGEIGVRAAQATPARKGFFGRMLSRLFGRG